MSKRNVLVIDLEYYIENANTLIVQRICNLLSEDFNVTIATYCPINSRLLESNDYINIISLPYYSLNKSMNSASLTWKDAVRIVYYAIKAHFKKNSVDIKNALIFVDLITTEDKIENYDVIVSFSNPFISHYSASILSKKYNIPWLAYYFDPFFSNSTFDSRYSDVRREKEEDIMSFANKIFMTYPTNVDYISHCISFAKKIIKTEMPGIRKNMHFESSNISKQRYRCYFIGNLYSDIRNPDTVINLFASLKDVAELFFVGGYYGQQINIEDIPNNVHFIGKRSGNELSKAFKNADFLINIGNSITNQMPSKIFEYISTGKPIINFYKCRNCPTIIYTSRYDLALNIYEGDINSDLDKVKSKILSFLRCNVGKYVLEDCIYQEFVENTDEMVSDFLIKHIIQLIGE